MSPPSPPPPIGFHRPPSHRQAPATVSPIYTLIQAASSAGLRISYPSPPHPTDFCRLAITPSGPFNNATQFLHIWPIYLIRQTHVRTHTVQSKTLISGAMQGISILQNPGQLYPFYDLLQANSSCLLPLTSSILVYEKFMQIGTNLK
jgi:hypothetical protein